MNPTDKATILHRLKDWPVDALSLHPGGSNYVFVARLKPPLDASQTEQGAPEKPLLAVYKPAAGERPLRDFPYGSLHNRERAAYLVSEALGWPRLPPVVVRDGPHGPGSMQLYIDHDPAQNFFTMRDACLPLFAPVAAFDVLVHNADRKGGALLKGNDGRIWAIDNALTFNPYARRRTVMFEFSGEPYPSGIDKGIQRLISEMEQGKPLREELSELLDDMEMVALLERAEKMLKSGVHPKLDPQVNVPWPYV